MSKIEGPFYPIIYVRGYAMTESAIGSTTATPYMGLNLGSTKIRQNWEGDIVKHYFESPLLRLMKEHDYQDVYLDGKEKVGEIPVKSIIIHRYYDQADGDFGNGKVPSIPQAASELSDRILKLRKQICGKDREAINTFKVHLVAHSMGGLICRCFLQNEKHGSPEARDLVDKVYTYATPHNGIEMRGWNVPQFLNFCDMNNFNRKEMAKYLDLPKNSKRVDSLNGKFPEDRFFCLVGTDHKDYNFTKFLTGESSDGLVKIKNATIQGSPRAFVYRSHSGPFGIVNSEEGYQNLVRFLFGNVRVDGILEPENLPLPPSLRKAFDEDKKVRGSYFFEATVSPRGAMTFTLTERRKATCSAVFRKFDELFPKKKQKKKYPRHPVLFSTFLDTRKITADVKDNADSETLVFSIDLAVSSTEFEVDGALFLDEHIPGEHLYRHLIVVHATPADDGWQVQYRLGENKREMKEVEQDEKGMYIPLTSEEGFIAKLRLVAREWV